jgi:DNA-binding transcriptional MocR family regulator
VPGPILAASAAAWRDEAHVNANRAAYAQKMAAAKTILGNHFQQPGGGFFLWIKNRKGGETALRRWRVQGGRVLPRANMGREIVPGKTQSNPGFSYIRVALVSDLSTIMTALERVREILDL